MKKIVIVLLTLCLLLCGCGGDDTKTTTAAPEQTTAAQETTAAETTVPETTEQITVPETTEEELDDFALAESCIDKSVDELFALIGEPESSDYAPSCLGDGEDGNLYYEYFTVYTYREGDEETVVFVE